MTPPFGVLLVNLGTPAAPTAPAVRRYLREFLSDPRVVDTPRLIWWCVLNLIILVVRPPKVAKLYQSIWMEEGSPLLVIGKRQAAALAQALHETLPQPVPVELAMTYGSPAIVDGLDNLKAAGCERVLVLPLYPQYSGTTTAAIFDRVARELKNRPNLPELRFVNSYAVNPDYINALAESVKDYWQENGRPNKLLMSFHGIPEKYRDRGDPYIDQCQATAGALAQALSLDADQWLCSFQSRFGPTEWVKPYTDETLQGWGEAGVERVGVICPAFTADCLETLEEIAIQNRDVFLTAGGKTYHYIPALNDSASFIHCLKQLVTEHTGGWH